MSRVNSLTTNGLLRMSLWLAPKLLILANEIGTSLAGKPIGLLVLGRAARAMIDGAVFREAVVLREVAVFREAVAFREAGAVRAARTGRARARRTTSTVAGASVVVALIARHEGEVAALAVLRHPDRLAIWPLARCLLGPVLRSDRASLSPNVSTGFGGMGSATTRTTGGGANCAGTGRRGDE